MRPIALAVLVCSACKPETVELQGFVPDGLEADVGLAGATVEVRDDGGEHFAAGTTSADGVFRVQAPRGQNIIVTVAATDHRTAAFTGNPGGAPRFRIPSGEIYAVPDSQYAEWTAPFAGCPGLEGSNAVVGDVRILELTDPDTGEHPIVTTAWAIVRDDAGNETPGCYLDEDGLAWDPEADRTGASGRYVVPVHGAGFFELEVGYEVTADIELIATWPIFVPDDGVVPRWPTWVEFAAG